MMPAMADAKLATVSAMLVNARAGFSQSICTAQQASANVRATIAVRQLAAEPANGDRRSKGARLPLSLPQQRSRIDRALWFLRFMVVSY
jgi:hypothetical protein